jgi:hypothetical protein
LPTVLVENARLTVGHDHTATFDKIDLLGFDRADGCS